MLNLYTLKETSPIPVQLSDVFSDTWLLQKLSSLYYWKIGQTKEQSGISVPAFLFSYSAIFWEIIYQNYFSAEEFFEATDVAFENAQLGTPERGALFRFYYILDEIDYTVFQEQLVRHFHQVFIKRAPFVKIVPYLEASILSVEHNEKSYLRHLEVNPLTASITVLPIPYFYFYAFLLDQTALWKTVLMELAIYHKD